MAVCAFSAVLVRAVLEMEKGPPCSCTHVGFFFRNFDHPSPVGQFCLVIKKAFVHHRHLLLLQYDAISG
jgi:hypothetical protein